MRSRRPIDPQSDLGESEEALFPRYRAGAFDLGRALRDGNRLDAIDAFHPQRALRRRLPRLALPGSVAREQEAVAAAEETATELTWIQVRLLDEAGTPMTGTKYRIEPRDGGPREGTLDANGEARVDGIEPGSCKVSFPDLAERPLPEARA